MHTSSQTLHPAVWRATQLAQAEGQYIDTGYAALSQQLPGQGWPVGQLTELLIPQPGSAELQLLLPALRQASKTEQAAQHTLVLLNPPKQPHIAAWVNQGVSASSLLWLRPASVSDTLWVANRILRSSAFKALLLWQPAIMYTALRKLQLAAQQSNMLVFILRPQTAATQASPAPLRLQVQTAPHGADVRILKRRGSVHLATIPVYTPLHRLPGRSRHASLHRHPSTVRPVRSLAPGLAV